MSIVPNFKDVVELIKIGSDIEAQEKIMELREYVLDIQEQNQKLKSEISELKKLADLSSKLSFKKPFYYIEGDETPYCPKC